MSQDLVRERHGGQAMVVHELKTWPEFFDAIVAGHKTFELRYDDRGFRVGHTLRLQEWDPEVGVYTGRQVDRTVSHIMRGAWCLPPGYALMSLQAATPNETAETLEVDGEPPSQVGAEDASEAAWLRSELSRYGEVIVEQRRELSMWRRQNGKLGDNLADAEATIRTLTAHLAREQALNEFLGVSKPSPSSSKTGSKRHLGYRVHIGGREFEAVDEELAEDGTRVILRPAEAPREGERHGR